MKTMSKILTVIALVVLCVSLFTLSAFAVTEVPEKPATCTEDGLEAYYIGDDGVSCYKDAACTQYIGSFDEIKIPKLEHKNATKTAAKVATCKSEGNDAYWYCPDCKTYFADADGSMGAETTLDAVKKPQVGHKAAEGAEQVAAVPATCGKDGTKAYWICQWCGQKISAQENGSVLSESQLVDPATGAHTWGEWTEVSPATASHGGTEERVCSVCGETETRTIGATGMPAADDDLFYLEATRDTYYRGEELPSFWSDLIEKLNTASGPNRNYVGVRIGTDKSMYANSYDTFDFWSSGDSITLGQKLVDNLDEGTYYIWVYNKNNPKEHTNSIPWYIVDTPTLDPINTDKHVVNSTKNLRFRASEPIKDASVKVGGKTLLDDNYYYVSNDGLTITLSPDFLNERQVGTYTISANTVSDNTKVSTHFYILSTASASASPKTGDESQLGLWAAFLLLSGAAVVVLVPKIRKHGA